MNTSNKHYMATAEELEAEMLLNEKLKTEPKPKKAHKVMINGWEDGKYIHKEMWDVSEFFL